MSKLSVNEQKTKYEEKGRDARKSRRGWWQQLDESPSDATASSCAPSSLHSLPLPPASEFKFQRVCSSLGRCRGRWGNVLHFISYSRYKKGHAHNQLYDLLGAILEEVDDICYSISKKNIMCFKGGEYNKMLKKLLLEKEGT